MTVSDMPGQFWCSQCSQFFPDEIEDVHMASHADRFDAVTTDGPARMLFWLACIGFGGMAGLAVSFVINTLT